MISEELEQRIFDHFMFFLVTIAGYAFSYLFIQFLSLNFSVIYPKFLPSSMVYLVFPTYVVLTMILIAYAVVRYRPEMQIKNYPSLLYQLVIILIMASGYSITYSGGLTLKWHIKEFNEVGLGYLIIVNYILYTLAVLSIARLLYNPHAKGNSKYFKIIRVAMIEFSVMIFVAFLTIQIIFSVIYYGLENYDLTSNTIILLLFLFAIATQPEIPDGKEDEVIFNEIDQEVTKSG